MAKNIKPRSQDFPRWYQDVVSAAKLADNSPVRGCMVIRPEGYAIWEAIQRQLDTRFKQTGHVNAYFPLLIPQSFLTKEAQHVEGFAMECAIVTHSKLVRGETGLKPAGELEEPLIIRPTSETMIGHMYAQWVQSYRDLPLLINQWANVMRWELRTRLFLRTSEFLWQEGHTAHETEAEAHEETIKMLGVYADFAENVLAIPVIQGAKTDSEKFPGAVTTYCIEALMQDGKALQCGTSHDLGQNFSKAFEIKFLGRDQQQAFAWTTSWGVSTRLIGALIMAHSDDEGLVLPPRVAPDVAAVVPIYKTPEDEAKVRAFVDKIIAALTDGRPTNKIERHGLETYLFDSTTEQRIVADFRDSRPGDKHFHWEQRGVPFRIEVGPRDVDQNSFVLKGRIDNSKTPVKLDEISGQWLKGKLNAAHTALFEKAQKYREENTRDAATYDELKQLIKEKSGFVRCFFKPDRAAEQKIKEETKATVRVIPFAQPGTKGKCIYSGEETDTQVLFAQAY
ncbi:MAG TPA: proline--tRNA ligase [Tepidisphaeraceae bacterium]|jgi:prolyl-tRNA synthetase|nr:proline--tRNA ligase [Tepidisphaeraceae bacterium]